MGYAELGRSTDEDERAEGEEGEAEGRARVPGRNVLWEDPQEAAASGFAGTWTMLPWLETIQRSFGRHKVGHVQAYVGAEAALGARRLGANAYAMGERIAFGRAPDLWTAAHEAAHVVQQRGGVELAGGVGAAGDAYERHADAVADRVVRGESSEALLDRYGGAAGRSAAGSRAIQRHAIVGDTLVKPTDKVVEQAGVRPFVEDELVRQYKDEGELADHAAKKTDYLGNLAKDGTWVRFSPTGTNMLGENHTYIPLDPVLDAVGSRSFIHERFTPEQLEPGSNLEAIYERDNAQRFQSFHIEDKKDKREHGAETLLPKIAWVLVGSLPYFEHDTEDPIKDLLPPEYAGKPFQRYLKFAWAYATDRARGVLKQREQSKEKEPTDSNEKPRPIPPKLGAMVDVVVEVAGSLDKFITELVADGYLGEALQKSGKQRALLKLLSKFARAFIDAAVEDAVDDTDNGLDKDTRQKFAGTTSDDDRNGLFTVMRNNEFHRSLLRAAETGVRYAGMGGNHYKIMLERGIPDQVHPFAMMPKAEHISKFIEDTDKLRELVKQQKKDHK